MLIDVAVAIGFFPFAANLSAPRHLIIIHGEVSRVCVVLILLICSITLVRYALRIVYL